MHIASKCRFVVCKGPLLINGMSFCKRPCESLYAHCCQVSCTICFIAILQQSTFAQILVISIRKF